MNHHVRHDCRLCGAARLTKVLDLGSTPLANEFPTEPCVAQERFPLYLVQCDDCGHVQLPVVVDPERLFRDYVYVSGTSPVFRRHFEAYAEELFAKHLEPGDLVVEIGSNDGTLLGYLQLGRARVLGIEPAEKIAKAAMASGIESWPVFFTKDVAQRIAEERGRAKVVVANNVFAHADDLRGMARAIKRVLRDDGVFVFEVSYLVDVLDKTLFDTIYHEHLAYHSVEPLMPFFADLGMSVVDAERVDTHGGSIRVTVTNTLDARRSERMVALWVAERRLPYAYIHEFARSIDDRKRELGRLLHGAKMAGKTIAGYGAPAKATTLLHTFDLARGVFDFVVDDSPLKQGRYMPGSDIPVLPSSAIAERRPDYVVVLAWNFADSILEKLSAYREAGGKVVVPLPKVTVH